MGYYTGTEGANIIAPWGVSTGVSANPAGSLPGDGNDVILGYGGNDILSGGDGGDLIMGGDGNDDLRGGAGADSLYGGDGDDVIRNEESPALTDPARDLVFGGNGNDLIYAMGPGAFEGNAGNDRFVVTPSFYSGQQGINGGSGTDTLDFSRTHYFTTINLETRVTDAPNLVFGQIENVVGNHLANTITGDAGANRIEGGDGRDSIDGGNGRDVLFGDGDGDYVSGGSGSDEIHGGDGNDILHGNRAGVSGGGSDRVYGDNGDDILISSGAGTYDGGAGNDTIFHVVGGSQRIEGGEGSDTVRFENYNVDTVINLASGYSNVAGLTISGVENLLVGGGVNGGDDRLYGTAGDNRIVAAGGDDLVYGFTGEDELFGGYGDDTLRGGHDDDRLVGAQDDDWLLGGLGADVLEGGTGFDRFDFNSVEESNSAATDTILGFDGAGNAAGDVIDLQSIDANTGASGDQAFRFLGAMSEAEGRSQGAGALWLMDTGTNTYVRGNIDADGVVELSIRITDNAVWAATDYTAADFYL